MVEISEADGFTASGIGENLGYFGSEQNRELAGKSLVYQIEFYFGLEVE